MLEDPEKPKEVWTDYVWADNEAEAMQKCQIKAQEATVQGKTVVRLIGLPLILPCSSLCSLRLAAIADVESQGLQNTSSAIY
jgi:hypothetical protein